METLLTDITLTSTIKAALIVWVVGIAPAWLVLALYARFQRRQGNVFTGLTTGEEMNALGVVAIYWPVFVAALLFTALRSLGRWVAGVRTPRL